MNPPVPEPPDAGDFSTLEAELRLFTPAQSTADLHASIAAALASSHPAPRSNHLLLTFLSLGAAAAVIIVSLLSLDFFEFSHPPFPSASPSAVSAPAPDSRTLIAQLASGQDPFDNLHVALPIPH
ncbi:MAG TPA: hypothetical protein VGN88_02315 [Phycisphaerae bacterium]|jgi:hypothetical protein